MLAKSKLIFNTSTRINFWWLLMLIVPNLKEKYTTTISIYSHQKLILVEVLKINFDFASIKADILSLAKLRTYSRAKVDSPKYFIVQYNIGLSFLAFLSPPILDYSIHSPNFFLSSIWIMEIFFYHRKLSPRSCICLLLNHQFRCRVGLPFCLKPLWLYSIHEQAHH